MTLAESLLQWLDEEISSAKEFCQENRDFPLSYCTGFDSGKLYAFKSIKDYIKEQSK